MGFILSLICVLGNWVDWEVLIWRAMKGEPYPPLRGYFPTAVGKLILRVATGFFSFPTTVGKWPEGPIGLPFRQLDKSVFAVLCTRLYNTTTNSDK